MELAAIIVGGVSIVVSFIPCCGWLALIPAVVGLVLGIINFVQKNKAGERTTKTIVGLVLPIVAVIMGFVAPIISTAIFAAIGAEM